MDALIKLKIMTTNPFVESDLISEESKKELREIDRRIEFLDNLETKHHARTTINNSNYSNVDTLL